MKAINLIPGDRRRGSAATAQRGLPQGPAVVLIGLLAVALAFVTVYVLTTNTISDRKAKIANLQAQVAREQANAARLANYASFEKLAQTRAETIREIAATRFDWHGALSDLSKVVPADTSLQSLVGTVVPGASAGGTAAGAASNGTATALRGDVAAPAFELSGCTHSQDEVARLMSRLRLINGVTRVTLGDSAKQASSQPGATVSSAQGSTGSGGCGPNTPNFDLVVFFAPVPGAGATGPTAVTPVSTSAVSTSAAAGAAAAATSAATAGTSTTAPTAGTSTTGSATTGGTK